MFIVYSKPACPQCDQAKAFLNAKGVPFKTVMLNVGQKMEEGMEYITRDELLALIPNAKVMPQIMKDGQSIGSLPELKKLLA